MVDFERKLATEDADIAEITRGILTIQARCAAEQKRPLGRGTHTKGVCARATFEVFDLLKTVNDRALAMRLARGVFAKPGFYPATVRFANAASQVYADTQRDVRALSFSVELPPGVVAPAATRLDYSMNNATTFPINDAHAFAVFMTVDIAGNKAKTLLSLPFKDRWGFVRTAVLGLRQERGANRPYQQMRYWSTVPFRHGPDAAVKYSAIPGAGNPARALQNGPDVLRDELVRHVNEDAQMSSFDFGLQFLDTERMTYWGTRRAASFWIENASVEWNEAQAPFHIVGRLTLVPGSVLPASACEAMHIDVTEHSTPDSQPLGSINRARWHAEEASRKARLGTLESAGDSIPHGVTDMVETGQQPLAPGVPRSRFRRVLRWGAVVVLAALVVGTIIVGAWYSRTAAANIPAPEIVSTVRYLDQGWGIERESPDRETYYYTPQGAPVHGLRYSWFVHLERPWSRSRFADPDYLRSLNFIVDPVPTHGNPDQLPVGFARLYDDSVDDYVLDLTCAACHTGQLNVARDGKTTAIRIDGGQGMHAFTDVKPGHFGVQLGLSLAATGINPLKFNRFARNVLGPGSSLSTKARLWLDLVSVIRAIARVGRGAFSPEHYPVQEGFGRTDALARINNIVFGDHLDPANYQEGNAPVSFPYMWNIWKFDWVQYGASVSQPMARNVGEAMGTGATFHLVDGYGRPIPSGERYRTSISFENLLRIESTLQTLKPPRWPEDLLGSVDQAKVERGKTLFNEHCVGCHGPHVASNALKRAVSPLRLPDDPLWVIRWKNLKDVGTDPNAAINFEQNTYDLSRTGLTLNEVRSLLKAELDKQKTRQDVLIPALQEELKRRKAAGAAPATISEFEAELAENTGEGYRRTDELIAQELDKINLKKMNGGVGLNVLGLIIRERYYTDHNFSDQARACFEGFDMLDLPRAVHGYKPRPLQGVWATPPFLHNGSVPTLYGLLSPVADRPKRFLVGTREFDPVKVGYVYVTEPKEGSSSGFWLDTQVDGNRNIGHEFRAGYVPWDDNKSEAEQYQNGIIGPELTPEQRMDLVEYLKVHQDEPDPQPKRVPPDCFALLKGTP